MEVKCSPSWELRTASPRDRYGERRQRDPCLKHTYKTPTCWPATAYDVTTGRPQYKGRRENTLSTYFVFTDCFVWSVHSGKSTVFYLLSWRALARRLRSVWIRVLAIWHPMTQTIFVSFVWARSTHTMSLRGPICVHCELFSMKKLRSRLSFFSKKEWQLSASRDSGPTTAEARRRMKSWGSQLDLADELQRELPFSRALAENEGELLDCDDAISLISSDPIRLVLRWVMPRKSKRCLRVRKLRLNPTQSSFPAV